MASPDIDAPASQRRSGRVPKPTARYEPESESTPVAGRKRSLEQDSDGENDGDNSDGDGDVDMDGTTQRQRAATNTTNTDDDDGLGDNDDHDDDDEDDESGSDGGDFLSAQERRAAAKAAARRKAPAQASKRARPPAAKRVKTAHVAASASAAAAASMVASPTTAARPAALPTRPKKKTVRMDPADIGEGLYAEVFSSGDSPKAVAEQWHRRWEQNDSQATTDMVNLLLQCTGCSGRVTVDDINDPDQCPARLTELQIGFQEQPITEYPLISRTKKNFRAHLAAFLKAVIRSAHDSGRLYKYPEMFQNLVIWPQTMSSSTLRPFRHTATAALLLIAEALVDVALALDGRVSKHEQGLRSKSTKGGGGQAHAEIKRSLDQANNHRKVVAESLEELLNTVVVNRYRDKEPRIRAECVEALGYWIWNLPSAYLDSKNLRYLGWLLSDTAPVVRHEVVRQLTRIIDRDFQQLGQFIDRFRPRIVEMARCDADATVRVAAIGLVETLRAVGLLEPDEVDEVCKIIFDVDPRVRKAVAPFVKACIDDLVEAKVEDLGGDAALAEAFESTEERDFESRRREWVTIKALAETLAASDAQLGVNDGDGAGGAGNLRPVEVATELFRATLPETHMALAAGSLYDVVDEIKEWEMVAGYLLVDHTTSARSGGPRGNRNSADAADAAIRKALAPEPAEEAILLEVLHAVAQIRLQTPDADRSRRSRQRNDAVQAHEESIVEFAAVLPRLLAKFGADPATAVPVLRMEHHLDLGMFQQLRQDASNYEKLLDEIVKQFERHDSERVVAEAAACLVHARQHEDLEEVVEAKLAVLWDNLVNTIRNFDRTCELSMRGNLGPGPLRELATVLMKMRRLASATTNCVAVLEATADDNDDNDDGSSHVAAINLLLDTVHRGKLTVEDPELDDLEDEVAAHATSCCEFYMMWKVRSLLLATEASKKQHPIATDELAQLATRKHQFSRNLVETFSSRRAFDDLRLYAAGSFCDLHVLFTSLQPVVTAAANRDLATLIEEVDPALVPELSSIIDAAERNLAKKARKKLNDPDDDEEPEDDDDDDDDDADALANIPRRERLEAEARAEKALCDLASKYILAMAARVLDVQPAASGQPGRLQRRMMRNSQKLGQTYKEILAFLKKAPEELQVSSSSKQKNKPSAAVPKRNGKATTTTVAATNGKTGTKGPTKSSERVTLSDDEDDGQESELSELDNLGDDDMVEEDSPEDLRRRGLLDEDPIVDDDDEDEGVRRPPEEDDSVIGD